MRLPLLLLAGYARGLVTVLVGGLGEAVVLRLVRLRLCWLRYARGMVVAAIRWFGEAVVLRHGGVLAVFAGYATREGMIAVVIR